MSEAIEFEVKPTALVPVQDSGVVLMPVMNIAAAKQRLAEFQEFVKGYLVPEEDYGTIPGTPKPTLFKPGADKLCELYGLADDFNIESKIEDYTADPPLFDYTIKYTLTARRDGRLVGTGVGSCNSWEGKYRWRESRRKCPLCGKEAIIKGKEEYGGGWVCFKKKEGCGAKFLDTDESITGQKAGKEVNDDICTLKNTILKMAKKRAKVDAVISVTRSSGIFTQDMDDIGETGDTGQGTRAAAQRVADKKIAEAKKAPAKPPDTLFYTYPLNFNGHFAEFTNLKAYGDGLNEVAQEGLRSVLKKFVKKSDSGAVLVPSEKMQELLEKLVGDCGVNVHKLEAAK